MKMNNRYLSWILAMLMVLPVMLQMTPLAAADISSWENADYANLPEVDQEILERYLNTDWMQDGISAKGNLNFGAEINVDMDDMDDDDFSGFEMDPIVIAADGNMDLTYSKNQNFSVLGQLNVRMYGMEQTEDFAIYVVDHPKDVEKLRVIAVVHGADDDEYVDGKVDRSKFEEALASLPQFDVTVKDFNKIADLRLIEDQGDKIHAVMLIHPQAAIDHSKETLRKSGNRKMAEDLLDDLDDVSKSFAQLHELLGFDDMVIPVEVVIEKESGKPLFLRLNGMGLQRALSVMMMNEADDDESVDFKLKNFEMAMTDITVGVDGSISVPSEVLKDLEAHRAEVEDDVDFLDFEDDFEDVFDFDD